MICPSYFPAAHGNPWQNSSKHCSLNHWQLFQSWSQPYVFTNPIKSNSKMEKNVFLETALTALHVISWTAEVHTHHQLSKVMNSGRKVRIGVSKQDLFDHASSGVKWRSEPGIVMIRGNCFTYYRVFTIKLWKKGSECVEHTLTTGRGVNFSFNPTESNSKMEKHVFLETAFGSSSC